MARIMDQEEVDKRLRLGAEDRKQQGRPVPFPYLTENDAIQARSGAVTSRSPLVAFLYHLLRDHLPAGVVERILREHVLDEGGKLPGCYTYCNGWLASYAQDIAARMDLSTRPKTSSPCIPTDVFCPEPLLGLRDDVNNHLSPVHCILISPEFFTNFVQATDAMFDRETNRFYLVGGVMGYWHRLPIIQRMDLPTPWLVV